MTKSENERRDAGLGFTAALIAYEHMDANNKNASRGRLRVEQISNGSGVVICRCEDVGDVSPVRRSMEMRGLHIYKRSYNTRIQKNVSYSRADTHCMQHVSLQYLVEHGTMHAGLRCSTRTPTITGKWGP
jgi:hypothetical protein